MTPTEIADQLFDEAAAAPGWWVRRHTADAASTYEALIRHPRWGNAHAVEIEWDLTTCGDEVARMDSGVVSLGRYTPIGVIKTDGVLTDADIADFKRNWAPLPDAVEGETTIRIGGADMAGQSRTVVLDEIEPLPPRRYDGFVRRYKRFGFRWEARVIGPSGTIQGHTVTVTERGARRWVRRTIARYEAEDLRPPPPWQEVEP